MSHLETLIEQSLGYQRPTWEEYLHDTRWQTLADDVSTVTILVGTEYLLIDNIYSKLRPSEPTTIQSIIAAERCKIRDGVLCITVPPSWQYNKNGYHVPIRYLLCMANEVIIR